MKAIRLDQANGPLVLADVPDPEPGPDDVVVRVAGCGVCHTDIGFWRDGVPTRHGLPITLGHEVSGVVEAAGSFQRHWLGREVIVPAVIPCGACDLCRAGRGNACRRQVMPGNDLDGGFAERVRVPAHGLCPVDSRDGYDLAELSVIADAVSTPYQAIARSGLQRGGLAIVIGVGGVGGYAVQIGAARGAKVVAIDVDDARLAAIAPYGAGLTLNSKTTDFKTLKKEIAAFGARSGCQEFGAVVLECSGVPAGQETAYGLLGHAGVLVVVGFTLEKIQMRLSNLMALDATVQGNWGCRVELYPHALELVTSGRITLKPFIERHPLSLGPEVIRRVADHEIHRRAILEPARA